MNRSRRREAQRQGPVKVTDFKLTVYIGPEVKKALDERTVRETASAGRPRTVSDVVRYLIATGLGIPYDPDAGRRGRKKSGEGGIRTLGSAVDTPHSEREDAPVAIVVDPARKACG